MESSRVQTNNNNFLTKRVTQEWVPNFSTSESSVPSSSESDFKYNETWLCLLVREREREKRLIN